MVNLSPRAAGFVRLVFLVGGAGALALLAWIGLEWVTWPDVALLGSTDPPSTAFIDRYRSRTQADSTLRPLRWSPTDAISPFLADRSGMVGKIQHAGNDRWQPGVMPVHDNLVELFVRPGASVLLT